MAVDRPAPHDAGVALDDAALQSTAMLEAATRRVVESRTFRRSQRHREFLDHVVRATIADRGDLLKELAIGLEVFRRSAKHYDPRRDPIVRVEAARLRDKLARYYADEGAREPFELTLPVGAYRVHLKRRAAGIVAPHPFVAIAVFPFENLSTDPRDDAFRFGLADLLIDALSRVRGLRVVARLSAFQAQRDRLEPRAVARLLGVDHVIEGSLQRSGAHVRCVVHITRVRDATRLWSCRFDTIDANGDGQFAFQDEIATAILAAVESPATPADARLAPVDDLHAAFAGTSRAVRDLVNHARTSMQERSLEGYEKAVGLLERAIAIDPAGAPAHTRLAIVSGHLSGFADAATGPLVAKSRACAERALALDPDDGEARGVLAAIASRFDLDWDRAEPLYRDALARAPSSTFIHASFAWGLAFRGRFDEAIAEMGIAFDLDPLNLGTRVSRAFLQAYARRHAAAFAEFEAVLELEPSHLMAHLQMGLTHLWDRDPAGALAHFEQVSTRWKAHSLVQLCGIAAVAQRGDRDDAQRRLTAFFARRGGAAFSRFSLAMVYACLDEPGPCLDALAAAADTQDFHFPSVTIVPLFDAYREHPAFRALLARHRLAIVDPRVAEGSR